MANRSPKIPTLHRKSESARRANQIIRGRTLLMMLVLGCFMDMGILILLTTPILYPIATGVLGFNPYHFGVVLVLAYAIGLCTPPVGTSLFIGCSIAKTPVEKVVKGFMPFYLSMIVLLLLLTFVPALSIGLPKLLGLL